MSKKNQIMVSQTSPLAGMKPRHCSTRYLEETVLPEYGFRYLYQPGEQHGGQKRRATDLIWSRNTYQLHRIVQDPGNRAIYYLQDGHDRAFLHEELMHVSQDTLIPPDWVRE